MINMQRKHITTFLTYERHVENFISSNSWSMPPHAPGPVWRLELSMLESGEQLLLSGLLASVSRSLLRSLSQRRRLLSPSERTELNWLSWEPREISTFTTVSLKMVPQVSSRTLSSMNHPWLPQCSDYTTVLCSLWRTSSSSPENLHLIKTSYKLANYTRLVCILQPWWCWDNFPIPFSPNDETKLRKIVDTSSLHRTCPLLT